MTVGEELEGSIGAKESIHQIRILVGILKGIDEHEIGDKAKARIKSNDERYSVAQSYKHPYGVYDRTGGESSSDGLGFPPRDILGSFTAQ